MEDLIEFLRAALNDEERIAKAATPGPWRVDDETYAERIYAADQTEVVGGGRWGGEASVFETTEDAVHIARWNPARVLAEIEAKRQILDDSGWEAGEARAVLRLAQPYAALPGFRDEWRA